MLSWWSITSSLWHWGSSIVAQKRRSSDTALLYSAVSMADGFSVILFNNGEYSFSAGAVRAIPLSANKPRSTREDISIRSNLMSAPRCWGRSLTETFLKSNTNEEVRMRFEKFFNMSRVRKKRMPWRSFMGYPSFLPTASSWTRSLPSRTLARGLFVSWPWMLNMNLGLLTKHHLNQTGEAYGLRFHILREESPSGNKTPVSRKVFS